ncbi:MAG: hypothetical protein DME57_03190 [Verrucomicrobia bacterium]|nr:MAG: hypothetical protein DME57_03190 [Verrucomicrobiota bacterium]
MRKLAFTIVVMSLSCSAASEWVVVDDNEEYIAYADRATILVDLKTPRSSPNGNPHSSSRADSEFDCENPRMRTIAFSLFSGGMGNGDLVETITRSASWLTVTPGTLLAMLREFACG